MSTDKLAALKQIAAAVRQDAYAQRHRFEQRNEWGYLPISAPISDTVLHGHLNGGPHIGAYLFAANSDVVMVAAFDIDDHDGTVGWERVRDAALRLVAAAKRCGLNAWVVRSGGGAGIHIFFFWDKPQPAVDVRHLLAMILAAEGFAEEGKDPKTGTGLAAGKIEIFPKQPGVHDTEQRPAYGNLIAMPFGRKSVPLDAEMQTVDKPALIVTSVPVTAAPPPPEKRGGRKRAEKPDEVRDALTHIPAEEHRMWVLIGLILKATFDDGTAFSLWNDWSRTSPDEYPGEAAAARQWRSFKPNGSVTIGTLYHLAKEAGWSGPQRKRSAALVLSDFLKDVELWCDERRIAYATVTVDGHRENVVVDSPDFRLWLGQQFWASQGKPPTPEALKQMIERAAGIALFDNKTTYKAWVRVAAQDGRLYLDLGDPSWSAIEIDANDWRVIDDVPVRFIRPPSTRPLVLPERGGKLDDLRRFINAPDDDSFMLIVACMVAYMRPGLPLPILYLAGEQGSAKTTALRFISRLIDPRTVEAGSPPRNLDDLIVAAASRWLVTADNISRIGEELADALCRLSTGGGLEKRAHYTNETTWSIDVLRPMAMTGITPATDRPDFLDRCVLVTLEPPGGDEAPRLDEATLNAEFEKARPRILGALLDGVVMALRRLQKTRSRLLADGALPRMADFAIFAEAAGAAFGWEPGAFIGAHNAMLDGLLEDAAEADTLVLTIREWLRTTGPFAGQAKDLHSALTDFVRRRDGELPKYWPSNPTWMIRTLVRKVRPMKAVGILYTRVERGNRATHTLTLVEPAQAEPSAQDGLPLGEAGVHAATF